MRVLFFLFGIACLLPQARAVWDRSESLEWQTDLSECVLIAAVQTVKPQPAENKHWDSQKATCLPVESLKGTWKTSIILSHDYPNAKYPQKGMASALSVGERLLIFMVKNPRTGKCEPLNWFDLSSPCAIGSHAAYNNDCKLLADEKSILAAIRARLKRTAGVKNTQRRGLLVEFEPMQDMYHDFVITAGTVAPVV